MSNTNIPKIIHQIWIGDKAPDPFLNLCRQSVLDMHPSWQHMYHTTEEILQHPDVQQFHLEGILERCNNPHNLHTTSAHRADVMRLCIVYVYGGIYLDHDMFCIRPLDKFRNDKLLTGKISHNFIGEAIIGAPAGSEEIAEVLRYFGKRQSFGGALSMDLTPHSYINKWATYNAMVFCPHGRGAKDKYRHDETTHTVHCWREDSRGSGYNYHPYELELLKKEAEAIGKVRKPPKEMVFKSTDYFENKIPNACNCVRNRSE